jgi:hypothetical protein
LDLGGTIQEVQISGFGSALGNYAIVGKPSTSLKVQVSVEMTKAVC